MNQQKFWVGTVSKEHVVRGKSGGFAQLCHGKQSPLKSMQAGDILIYYSPNEYYGEKSPYQCFTALGAIIDKPIYQIAMGADFIPYRRDVRYLTTIDAPIKPLISQLSFIRDKNKWGYVFRFGVSQIPCDDFIIIAEAMRLEKKQINELLI
jgi:hypothetical protein